MTTTHELIAQATALLADIESCELALASEPTSPSRIQDMDDAVEAFAAWCEDDVPRKLAAIDYVARRIDADVAHRKAEASYWRDLADRAAKRVERLRASALRLFKAWTDTTGESQLRLEDGRVAKVATRTSTAVNLTDEAMVPGAYRQQRWHIDKRSLLKALRAGEVVPGASLEKREKQSLSLK